MEIIKILLGPIAMFFPVRRLAQQLQNASLAVLRSNSVLNQFFELEWPGASEKQIKMIDDLWLKRVLLLVTGVDDVLAVLDKLEDNLEGDLYYQLIEGYSKQAKSIDSIILLLNKLWEHADTASKILKALNADTESMMLRVLDTEFMLAKRAKELSVAPGYALGNLEAMAEKIEDAVDDGRGSKTSEDIVIALALPILKGDLMGAIKFADSLRLIQSHHRFLTAFVRDNGVINGYQVRMLTKLTLASELGGQELATTILQAVEKADIEISRKVRLKLEKICNGSNPRYIPFADFLDDLFSDDDSDDEDLPSMTDMLDMMARLEALSGEFFMTDSVHSQSGHGHISSPIGSGLFGCGSSSEALKDSISELLGSLSAERQTFSSKEEAAAQMEKDLLKIVENGNIKRATINHMLVGEFLEKNPELISQEARATIQAALA